MRAQPRRRKGIATVLCPYSGLEIPVRTFLQRKVQYTPSTQQAQRGLWHGFQWLHRWGLPSSVPPQPVTYLPFPPAVNLSFSLHSQVLIPDLYLEFLKLCRWFQYGGGGLGPWALDSGSHFLHSRYRVWSTPNSNIFTCSNSDSWSFDSFSHHLLRSPATNHMLLNPPSSCVDFWSVNCLMADTEWFLISPKVSCPGLRFDCSPKTPRFLPSTDHLFNKEFFFFSIYYL